MEEKKFKRSNYFIHFSAQSKYILMSILPVILLGCFSLFFIIKTGEFIFTIEKAKILQRLYIIEDKLPNIEDINKEDIILQVLALRKELSSVYQDVHYTYLETLQYWKSFRNIMFLAMFLIVFISGFLSLLYSHRIVGPIYRLRRCLEMMGKGENPGPIRLRNYDEFKELAKTVEELRQQLSEKGDLR